MTVAEVHLIYQLEISSDFLNELKEDFRNAIKSRRRESCINHISELINILWKRDIIRKQTCQSILLYKFKNETVRQILQNYIDHLDHFDSYNYDENCTTFQQPPSDQASKSSFQYQKESNKHSKTKSEETTNETIKNFYQQKTKIYNHIANQMERQWMDVGRELELSESTLVNFENKFSKDIKSITHQILLNAEEKFGDDIVIRLILALSNARRGDLARFVKRTLNIL